MSNRAANRDIIVIGASAGGVEALKRLAGNFRADLPAAVFVVLHVGAASRLAAILDGVGPSPAADAKSGEPVCSGRIYVALWEIEDGDLLRYRCHVGHGYTADVVLESKDNEGENTLWALLRSHQERAALARRMAARATQNPRLAAQLEERAQGYDEDASVVRQILASQPEATDVR